MSSVEQDRPTVTSPFAAWGAGERVGGWSGTVSPVEAAATPGLVDAPFRSLVKAISWRLTGTIDTVLVSLLVTRHVGVALSIGSIELFTKLTLYYLHERVWNQLAFGRTKLKDDYEI
jgi:uncharacterized membrane protein